MSSLSPQGEAAESRAAESRAADSPGVHGGAPDKLTAPEPYEPRNRRGVRYPYLFWSLVALSLVALVLGAWLLIQGGNDATQAAASPPITQAAKPAPAVDFTLTSIDGKQIRLNDLRGKVVLVNFWATWCPPCKAEMPDLEAIYRENGETHNFVIVAVDVEEEAELTRAFAKQYGLTFPLLPDPDGRVSNNRYFIRSLPTSFIIDRAGNVRYQWSGQQSRASMLSRLQTVW